LFNSASSFMTCVFSHHVSNLWTITNLSFVF
jgi:hypothetical protein